VLVHSFDYPPLDGGIAQLSARLAEAVTRRGFSVHALSCENSPPPGSVRWDGPVPVVRVAGGRGQADLNAIRRLRSTGGEPVVSSVWYPEGVQALLARARPRVVLVHGLELLPPAEAWRRGVWARLRRRTLESADLVVSNSRYTAELARRTAPRARVVTIPPGVDLERFTPGDAGDVRDRLGVGDSLVVLTVARLVDWKGIDVVIDAIARLDPEVRSGLVYLISGRGPEEGVLRQRARERGVEDTVRFLGFVESDELPGLYRAADIFALCSHGTDGMSGFEGFGLVLLEAQASGTAVLGARSGGIPDAIADAPGAWLVEDGSADAVVEVLREALRDPDAVRRSGQANRAAVEARGAWDGYAERFVEELAAVGISP
jgi:phosphatidylinositol alpha-1,6-mannosyltransferase